MNIKEELPYSYAQLDKKKVDKVEGKGLSDNNLTNELRDGANNGMMQNLLRNTIDVISPDSKKFLVYDADKKQIYIKANTSIIINKEIGDRRFFNFPSNYYIEDNMYDIGVTDSTIRSGNHFYIYLVVDSNPEVKIKFSLNSNNPIMYDTKNNITISRRIGGYYCLDQDISDYKKGDILPSSIWDLQCKPYPSKDYGDTKGYLYSDEIDEWVENPYYLDGSQTNRPSLKIFSHEEILSSFYKTMPVGVYSGGTLTRVSANTVAIAPHTMWGASIENKFATKVENNSTVNVNVTNVSPFVIARLSIDSKGKCSVNYINASEAAIKVGDVVFGAANFSGSMISLTNSFNYGKKSIPITPEVQSVLDDLQKQIDTLTQNLTKEITDRQNTGSNTLGAAKKYTDDVQSVIMSALGEEAATRIQKDAETLTSAKAYTDAETNRSKAAESTLQTAINTEATTRTTKDAETLSAAKTYADSVGSAVSSAVADGSTVAGKARYS